MLNAIIAEPEPNFRDPRLCEGFEPQHWPLCNGGAASFPDATDPHDRRCLEFLAGFYRLNLLHSRLLEFREKSAPEISIQDLLSKIAVATSDLEKTEDRYSSIGLFGEPEMDGVRYRNIVFVHPQITGVFTETSVSPLVAIPGLEEIPASELKGPAKIIRFGHGKVDL